MIALYPSLMAADLLNLKSEITKLEPHCNGFHMDVMDHTLVPNLTWGPDIVNAVRKVSKKTIWVDLLVDRPTLYLDKLELHRGDIVTLHHESRSIMQDKEEFSQLVTQLKERGLTVSIAISPKTPVKVFAGYLDQIDHAILMSVEPGFSGNPFMRSTLTRLPELHTMIKQKGRKIMVGLDGGINEETFLQVKPLGVDIAAIGSGIFGRPDAIKALKWYNQ
ncbi:TPA: hypothetical protein DDZ86_01705 [Candidatus Dependentiae bacterium]|nr:MAG: Ribulose-phosphate 3-epimerase [candidate division TM6 bacterium GW2011_GWF2_43_87]HBL98339.1 hypothetical protein [Candidatus Dependentiae bacterium]